MTANPEPWSARGSVVGSEERRHRAGPSLDWCETWSFDWVVDDGFGGFVEVTVFPRRRRAWFIAAVVRRDRPYVLCRDLDLDPPADPGVLELRGGALWMHAICETPLVHWTVAMEAYAVALDDPYEAWRTERGDRIGLAFDLEWESDGAASRWTAPGHYAVEPCVVSGDLQVGADHWPSVVTTGRRSHRWGPHEPDATVSLPVNGDLLAAPYLAEAADGSTRRVNRPLR